MSQNNSNNGNLSNNDDLENIILTNTTNTSNETLLNKNDKNKIATNCCVYMCELVLGLLCCLKI